MNLDEGYSDLKRSRAASEKVHVLSNQIFRPPNNYSSWRTRFTLPVPICDVILWD